MKDFLLKTFLCICLMSVILCGCGNNDENDLAYVESEEGEIQEEPKNGNVSNNAAEDSDSSSDGIENDDNLTETEEIPVESINISEAAADIDESNAEAWGECGENLTWYYRDHILVIRGNGKTKNYSRDYSDQPWADIRDDIYWGYIEDGITSIGNYAFAGCSNLRDIDIPDGITTISDRVFFGCSSITSIDVPDSVTYIGGAAFENCSSLTSIHLPDSGVDYIAGAAFCNCISLTEINIPDSVPQIFNWTFMGCSSLTDISIPDSVTYIGTQAFRDCTSLTSIHLPDGVHILESYAFGGCSNLTDINIPDGITKIGGEAFRDCVSLTGITLPDSVTTIGFKAFAGCSNLTDIIIPDSVTTIEGYAFMDCTGLTSLNLPDSLTPTGIGIGGVGPGAFRGCDGLIVTFKGQEYTIENDPGDWWWVR